MADVVSRAKRSQMMAGIKSKGTKPEMIVRKGLHARCFRYRLHEALLPGKPDLVFPRFQSALFVNGCFWHGHHCSNFKLPKTRTEFWKKKIEGNKQRDRQNSSLLEGLGYRVKTVWECETRKSSQELECLLDQLAQWLRSTEIR